MMHLFVRASNYSRMSWLGCVAAQLSSAESSGGEVGTDRQTAMLTPILPAVREKLGKDCHSSMSQRCPGGALLQTVLAWRGCCAEYPARGCAQTLLLPHCWGGSCCPLQAWVGYRRVQCCSAVEPPFLLAPGWCSLSFLCWNLGHASDCLRGELWAELLNAALTR